MNAVYKKNNIRSELVCAIKTKENLTKHTLFTQKINKITRKLKVYLLVRAMNHPWVEH